MTALRKPEKESDGPTMTGDEKWRRAEESAFKERGGGKMSAVLTRMAAKSPHIMSRMARLVRCITKGNYRASERRLTKGPI
jgi:hypothetical protein